MTITERLTAVRERIAAACARCGRDPATVELLAVSKGHPAAAVREAFAAGQRAFGENRAQELVAKAADLADVALSWHMIGSVQTNKVRDLLRVPCLVLVQSVDRVALADKLQAALAALAVPGSPGAQGRGRTLDVLVEVNASGDATKHGCAPADVEALVAHVRAACPALALQGLMAMGPLDGDPRAAFALAADLLARLRDRFGLALPVLSLGMTGDLEAAIAAGSTMVRVGTGVFGERG